MKKQQKAELLDYVTGWHKKSVELMKGTSIKTAFVSTNSVTQNVHIDFAYRTFRWDSEANL